MKNKIRQTTKNLFNKFKKKPYLDIKVLRDLNKKNNKMEKERETAIKS